jgi:hypothetical protein
VSGQNFRRAVAGLSNAGSMIYLVDSSGGVHTVDVDTYAALTEAELRGSRVFLDPAKAERCGEIRRAGRN